MARAEAASSEGATVAGAMRRLAREFLAAGLDTPALDARLLVAAATGETVESLVLRPDRGLGGVELQRIDAFARRRLAREPVSRILGRRDFHGHSFQISPDTLDPRADSETVVELALSLIREEGWPGRPLRILDLCTGTGCLLLSLLCELPLATGLGTDISAAALDVARRNAERLGLADRCRWQRADGIEPVAGPFDLAIANPPYIASAQIATLAPEVVRFDPHLALDGGDDGLSLCRRIVGGSARVVPSGWLVLEVGAGQADAVIGMVGHELGPRLAAPVRQAVDLGGHIRGVAWKTR